MKDKKRLLTGKKLYHGTAYYPELWPLDSIEQDVEYMMECGINVVRMGEFAWSRMEPVPDRFDFSLFESVMDRLYKHGIQTVFCTPSATPPVWLTHGHPDRCHVDVHGTVMSHGARQHICTDHPYVRERVFRFVNELSRALGRHPALLAWQTDNEFKCHVRENFSVSAKQRWHEWLQRKFIQTDVLNEAWGTAIWSEEYSSFEQVPMPLQTPCMHNPSLDTAFRRFTREMIAEYQAGQVAAIRAHSDIPVTHNGNLLFHADQDLMYKDLDFAAFDHYIVDTEYEEMLMHYERWRTLKPGKNFWVMETSASHNGSTLATHRPHRRGFVKAEAVAAYAFGSTNFGYWVWRQQRAGCEMTHGCVISTWQKPAIGYQTVLEVNQARQIIEPIILQSELLPAQVAISWSDHARIFLETESLEKLDYYDLMRNWTGNIRNTGMYFDLVGESADLSPYRLLYTPFSLSVHEELAARAEDFVRAGGIWIIGPLSGCRTMHHTVHLDGALGKLEKLAGVETVFTFPLSGSGAVGNAFGVSAKLGLWSHIFRPLTAQSMGTIEGGPSSGGCFITEQKVGKGKIVLLGSMPEGESGKLMLAAMGRHYAREAGVNLWFSLTAGTVVAPRVCGSRYFWFVINMDGAGGNIAIPRAAVDTITNDVIPCGVFHVSPYAYHIIEFDGDPFLPQMCQ